MRLYEGKYFRRALARQHRRHVESRDAIVWDVDTTNKLVRCKIQGSNELILCHYPRNWQTLPEFVKRGNAVRIAHKAGISGYLEVVGHGRAIPSPVAGDRLPTPQTLFDGLLTGGTIRPISAMVVEVGAATYRISGTVYSMTVEGVLMQSPALMTLGDAVVMGAGVYKTIEAAPAAGQARYDLIVAGTDGLVDVVKGTAAAAPVMPATPASHVKIGHVLVLGAITAIEDQFINALFEPPQVGEIGFSLASGTGTIDASAQFVYHATNMQPYCSLTATIKDQYGWNLAGSYKITFSLLVGTGDLAAASAGPWSTADIEVSILNGYQATIYYRRDENQSPEISPVIQVSIENQAVTSANRIQLLDGSGNKIA